MTESQFYTGRAFIHEHVTRLRPHVWTIISDSELNGDKLVILNFTTDDDIDPTCVIEPGEHPFISRTTYVNYRDAKIAEAEQLAQAVRARHIMFKDDLSEDLLQKIRAGAAESQYLQNKIRRFLAIQSVI